MRMREHLVKTVSGLDRILPSFKGKTYDTYT